MTHASYSAICSLSRPRASLVAGYLVFGEQFADPADEEIRAGQIAFELDPRRSDLAWPHPVAGSRLRLLGERRVARFHTGVFAQSNQRGLSPFWRHLIVEEAPNAVEDDRGDVEIGDLSIADPTPVPAVIPARL